MKTSKKKCRQCPAYLSVIKRLRERGNAAYTTVKMLSGELVFAKDGLKELEGKFHKHVLVNTELVNDLTAAQARIAGLESVVNQAIHRHAELKERIAELSAYCGKLETENVMLDEFYHDVCDANDSLQVKNKRQKLEVQPDAEAEVVLAKLELPTKKLELLPDGEVVKEDAKTAFEKEFTFQTENGLCGGPACINPDCYCDEVES